MKKNFWDFFFFFFFFLFPGPEGVPGIPLASSKGEVALACPHMLDALAAVSVSGLTGPPTSDLRFFLLSGLSGLERCLEGFDGNFVGWDPNGELFSSTNSVADITQKRKRT